MLLLTAALFSAGLLWGSVRFPVRDVMACLAGAYPGDTMLCSIIWDYRLPKALAALLTGAGLGLAGLLMQTMFRNPITGPYVLGLSSGAGLAVALWVMLLEAWGWGVASPYMLSLVAGAGSVLVLIADLYLYARTRNAVTLLIAGLMFGSFTGALLTLLSFWAPAGRLQKYVFWTMGNLGHLSPVMLDIMALAVAAAYGTAWYLRRRLDLQLLGDDYVASAGYSVYVLQRTLVLAAGVVTGVITAFTGPIAFVGLVVPHSVYLLAGTRLHRYTIPLVALAGASLMLGADFLAQLPGSRGVLPVNSITSLIGAPVVVWLLLRKR